MQYANYFIVNLFEVSTCVSQNIIILFGLIAQLVRAADS